ncbi:hypothetical protein SPRG_03682 [Saprolegnia parasitica CBS 223.65]|uniref:Uncharacterized protein n=1 Tax=Saprolegnia parasitica (strain CBS 223.65) TaxID=695850 RepID=A0A067CY97_SAPPC|nr:hypothetical protein SPRG_03682 [Saprolegnia parasitica CBS 223.65]KDO31762.1 hypothetical protein SPRG_03682 [Saprolegnia parasitica CBS 223.65]|eukprot:XP_012197642.1 hypothetical protein SPRG_03682 [Saprolegnia parasitica CBS 223.65]
MKERVSRPTRQVVTKHYYQLGRLPTALILNSLAIFPALIASSSSATMVAAGTPAMGVATKVGTEASHKQPQQLREGGQKECFGSICGGGFGWGLGGGCGLFSPFGCGWF